MKTKTGIILAGVLLPAVWLTWMHNKPANTPDWRDAASENDTVDQLSKKYNKPHDNNAVDQLLKKYGKPIDSVEIAKATPSAVPMNKNNVKIKMFDMVRVPGYSCQGIYKDSGTGMVVSVNKDRIWVDLGIGGHCASEFDINAVEKLCPGKEINSIGPIKVGDEVKNDYVADPGILTKIFENGLMVVKFPKRLGGVAIPGLTKEVLTYSVTKDGVTIVDGKAEKSVIVKDDIHNTNPWHNGPFQPK